MSLGEMNQLKDALWYFDRALRLDRSYPLAVNSKKTALELLEMC